jgi:Na+-transporting methylmalonyl-CoA/oxaloacetate decarboxylase gamma subunit
MDFQHMIGLILGTFVGIVLVLLFCFLIIFVIFWVGAYFMKFMDNHWDRVMEGKKPPVHKSSGER